MRGYPDTHRFRLSFAMDNAAFEEPTECGNILAELGAMLVDNPDRTSGKIYDSNGNLVGQWSRT